MGFLPVIAKLPTLLARIRQTADARHRRASRRARHHRQPRFHPSRRAARAARAARTAGRSTTSAPPFGRGGPGAPGRCAPMSIACWRCCRSSPRRTRGLGGPRCVYVGHPLIERLNELRPNADEARRRACRAAARRRAAGFAPFGDRAADGRFRRRAGALARDCGPFELVLPTLPHVESEVRARAAKVGGRRRASKSARRPSSPPFAPRAPRSPLLGR